MRVLIVVLSLEREPWMSLEQSQRETWIRPTEDVEFLWLRGITSGPRRAGFLLMRKVAERLGLRHCYDKLAGRIGVRRPVHVDGDIVRTGTFEYWIGTSAKMRAGLTRIVEHSHFEFLVRTNSSTYLHMDSLMAHLASAPHENYYGGADRGEAYGQGTCIILSRDLVELMANDPEWDYQTTDDVAVGLAAGRVGVTLTPMPQYAIASLQDIVDAGRWLSPSNFIFRFKNRGRRDIDGELMRSLHSSIG